jgi:hypothetical protein
MSVPQKSALVARICFRNPIPRPYSDGRVRGKQGRREGEGQGADGCKQAAQKYYMQTPRQLFEP